MKHIKRFWLMNFTFVVLSVITPAQENNWNIVELSGDTHSNCSLQKFNDSLLTFECSGIIRSIPVDSINCLFVRKESHFWTGAAVGGAAGIALGAVIGEGSYYNDNGWFKPSKAAYEIGTGILGGLAVFAVGGIIGASTGGDNVYEISSRNHAQKVMIIRMVMSK